MSDSHHVQVTRRGFLKSIGSIAGMVAASSLLAGCDTTRLLNASLGRVAALGEPLKVGVLLPRSASYPALGPNLLAGMRLYADQAASRPLHLVAEQIGAGQGDAHRGALKLLDQDRVDLLAGVMNPSVAASLRGTLAERRAFLVVADVGANVPRESEDSPFVAYSSLGYWRASQAMGRWAAQNMGRRAVIATSFYDGGYDTVYAFRLGFEAAGGQILDTYVSHRPVDADDHLTSMMAQIASVRPDLVYAVYSGRESGDFLRAYVASSLAGRVPLAGTSFTSDDQALDMPTAMPWVRSLDSAENRAFVAGYEAAVGHAPDMPALLGYDTAHLIDAAVEAAGDHRDTQRLQQALGEVAFASPRGAVAMDPYTRSLVAPIYLGTARHAGLEPLDVPAYAEQIAALRSSTKTGWTNAYLCV
jgi:branched-chain amino acid transport system substrate-binding protein